MFEWDENNLRKIRAHRIKAGRLNKRKRVPPSSSTNKTPVGESRYVYYAETNRGRLLAVVLTERQEKIRVITAYDLDAGQKHDYLSRRARGE